MDRANRIIYGQTSKILLRTGEAAADVLEHDTVTERHYLDAEYGNIDYKKQYIESINPVTKGFVLKELQN